MILIDPLSFALGFCLGFGAGVLLLVVLFVPSDSDQDAG